MHQTLHSMLNNIYIYIKLLNISTIFIHIQTLSETSHNIHIKHNTYHCDEENKTLLIHIHLLTI
jgi:hypothetical protein